MPTLYEYFGMVFYFYSNDHLPVHVHVSYAEYESIAELFFREGLLVDIVWRKELGHNSLPTKQKRKAQRLIELRGLEIANKWHEFFVLGLPFNVEKITKEL